MIKIITQILLFIFPWFLRRPILNLLFGYKISKKAKIGFSVLMPLGLLMEEESYIGHFNVIKAIDCVKMKKNSSIMNFNLITGYKTANSKYFKHNIGRSCCLEMEEHARITSRHTLDCNGGIYIGAFTTFAGIKSQILTHSIDFYKNLQDAQPVKIGKYCFIGTGSIILKGVVIPNYSIIGAGTLVNKSLEEQSCIYGGNPSKLIKKLNIDDVLYFKRIKGFVD